MREVFGMTSQLIQTCISIRPDQRQTLIQAGKDNGKSMSDILRQLIDEAYPALPEKAEPLPEIKQPATVVGKRADEIAELFKGTTQEIFNKLYDLGGNRK